MEFHTIHTGVPLTEIPEALWHWALEYHYSTEAYDQAVCSYKHPQTCVAIPTTVEERRLCAKNAERVSRLLEEHVGTMGFSPEQWRRAALRVKEQFEPGHFVPTAQRITPHECELLMTAFRHVCQPLLHERATPETLERANQAWQQYAQSQPALERVLARVKLRIVFDPEHRALNPVLEPR